MRSVLFALLSVTAAAQARAADSSPPVRVVLLDAVVLTPALERANARLSIEQGIMTSLRAHGWEPVSVAANCKDLNCAAAVAASAKTLYALIVSGRFAQGETYAADVAASLWRDGTVVATRTEVDEEAAAQKAGQEDAFVRCGPPGGSCTAKILETKLEQYAGRLVDDETAAIAAKRAAELASAAAAAAAAKQAAPVAALVAPPVARQEESHGGAARVAGWSLMIGGGVLVAGAVELWSQDNSGNECHVDGCRRDWRTHRAAIITGIGGVVAAAGGVTLLLMSSPNTSVALSVHQSGVVLGGSF